MTESFIVHEGDRMHTISWADVGRVQYLPEVIILGFKNRKMMITAQGKVYFGTLIRNAVVEKFEEDGDGTTDPAVYTEAWKRYPNATRASECVYQWEPRPLVTGCKYRQGQ